MKLVDLINLYDFENYYIFWYGYKCTDEYFDNNELKKEIVEIAEKEKECLEKTILVFKSTSIFTALYVGAYSLTPIEQINQFITCKYEKIASPIDELIGRLVIRNEKRSVFYYPKRNNKFTIEAIKAPKGNRTVKEFANYADFDLTFEELKEVIDYKYSDYMKPLSCVNGIYMIIDRKTGKQYVGKASGKNGLFGRFADYVKNGHGDDKDLVKLVERDPNYFYNYKFIILEVLSVTASTQEVLDREQFYMRRFMTKKHGYNN